MFCDSAMQERRKFGANGQTYTKHVSLETTSPARALTYSYTLQHRLMFFPSRGRLRTISAFIANVQLSAQQGLSTKGEIHPWALDSTSRETRDSFE